MAPLANRYASARRQARRAPIRVSAMERELGTRFTVDTLRALQRRWPKRRFVWLMGADNLAQFDAWRDWRQYGELQMIPADVRGTSLDFIDRAFDDPTFLDRMTARSKYRYSPFTDPVLQVAIEMQDNIDRKYSIDPSFVGSWAEKIAGTAGSLSSFILARKAGGIGQ